MIVKETCLFCGRIIPSLKKTNGDLIRAMSDEELAVTILCPNDTGMADILCDHGDDKDCYDCTLKWLRQKAGWERKIQEKWKKQLKVGR